MSYHHAKRELENALLDLSILSGDRLGPSGSTVHDVRKTCAVNLRVLAQRIERGLDVYPSPDEAVERLDEVAKSWNCES